MRAYFPVAIAFLVLAIVAHLAGEHVVADVLEIAAGFLLLVWVDRRFPDHLTMEDL